MPETLKNDERSVVRRDSTKESIQQGNFYALIIGVAIYKNHQSLEFPVKDARKIARILANQYTFPKKNITILENPTRTNIIDTLDGFEHILQPADSLLIFYAGHGHWEEKQNRGYWLPTDAKIRARAAWISNATLQDYLMAYVCQHVLVISDSCFSGALLMNRSAIEDAEKDIQILYSAKSRKAITSGVKEKVPDRSVFFKELCNFLKKNTQNFLSASDLFAGIRNKVIAMSPNGQNPQFGAIADTEDDGGDFIFIKKGIATNLSLEKPSPFDQLLQNPQIKERLFALRAQLDRDIPQKSLSKNLLIATWNIRKLGGDDFGGRTEEALAYIATIIDRYDIVAIQEIFGDLKILDRLKVYLGEHWDYFFSDTSIGMGGDDYRLGYFYDKRKVVQGGMISDLWLPSVRSRDKEGRFHYKPAVQLLRPPFNIGFKIADKRLILCNLHLVFGSQQRKEERLDELSNILKYWEWRTALKNVWSKNVVMLGNFQTEKLTDKEMYLIRDSVFDATEALLVPSNAYKNRYYNQMAFHIAQEDFTFSKEGGAFDFHESVFRPIDYEAYEAEVADAIATRSDKNDFESHLDFYKRLWRAAQMSDNLPLWVELKTE